MSRYRGKEIHELLCVIWFNGKWAPENGHLKQKRQFWRKNSNLVRQSATQSSNDFQCLLLKFWNSWRTTRYQYSIFEIFCIPQDIDIQILKHFAYHKISKSNRSTLNFGLNGLGNYKKDFLLRMGLVTTRQPIIGLWTLFEQFFRWTLLGYF